MERVLRGEAERMGIAAPDVAVRDFVFSMPGLRGTDGQFSPPVFEAFLRANEITEGQFLRLVRR